MHRQTADKFAPSVSRLRPLGIGPNVLFPWKKIKIQRSNEKMRNELTLKYVNNDTQMLARSALIKFLKKLKVQEM